MRNPAPQTVCIAASTSGTRARTPAGRSRREHRRHRGDPGQVDGRNDKSKSQVRNGRGCPRTGVPMSPADAEDQAGGVERGRDGRRQVAGVDRLRVAAGDDPPPAAVPELLLGQGAQGGPRPVGDLEVRGEPDQAARPRGSGSSAPSPRRSAWSRRSRRPARSPRGGRRRGRRCRPGRRRRRCGWRPRPCRRARSWPRRRPAGTG